MEDHNLRVTLRWRKVSEDNWHERNVLVEEYFEMERGEVAGLKESVARFNHGIEYLDVPAAELRNTQIEILDNSSKSSKRITETFWNNGQNRIIERVDKSPTSSYWEIIIDTVIPGQQPLLEIMRFHKNGGIIVPNYHGIFTDHADGSQTERKVHPPQTEDQPL